MSQGHQGNKTRSYPLSLFNDTQRPQCIDFTYNCVFCSIIICFMPITKTQTSHREFKMVCVSIFHDFNGIFNPCFRQCFLFAKIQGEEFEVRGILWSNGPISKSITKNPDRKWLERSLSRRGCTKYSTIRKSLAREWHEPSDHQGSISVPI